MSALLPAFVPRRDEALSRLEDQDAEVTQMLGRTETLVSTPRSSARRAAPTTAYLRARHPRLGEMQAIPGYTLIRLLGHGGMGVVHEALEIATGTRVALKTMSRCWRAAQASLRREIRAIERIDHTGVVRLRAKGTRRGAPFYAMDLLTGPTLATALRCGSRNILTLLRRLASTLAYVHACGIAHCDLTPSNVLLRGPDEPVLIDFGLARNLHRARPRETEELRMVGTLAYMAPEQLRAERIDARADLYAFGCILYEALTGRVPFIAERRATVLRQHLEATPCPPSLLSPDVPPALEELCLQLLMKTPAERASAAEIAMLLAEQGARDWPPSAQALEA